MKVVHNGLSGFAVLIRPRVLGAQFTWKKISVYNFDVMFHGL